jgi:hypothetical protein
VQNQYGPQGLQTYFFTKIYGYYKDEQNLTTAQELERDKEHWVEHYGLKPVRIGVVETALNPDTLNPTPGGRMKAQYQFDYKVMFIPTTFVIDRDGIIRFVSVGWVEPLLRRKIEETLAMKGTK